MYVCVYIYVYMCIYIYIYIYIYILPSSPSSLHRFLPCRILFPLQFLSFSHSLFPFLVLVSPLSTDFSPSPSYACVQRIVRHIDAFSGTRELAFSWPSTKRWRAQWHRDTESSVVSIVRCKDNKTIKSQIRGLLFYTAAAKLLSPPLVPSHPRLESLARAPFENGRIRI